MAVVFQKRWAAHPPIARADLAAESAHVVIDVLLRDAPRSTLCRGATILQLALEAQAFTGTQARKTTLLNTSGSSVPESGYRGRRVPTTA